MVWQPRIEFPNAFYHVMARGDRREPIFVDDEDRSMFLQTLSGFPRGSLLDSPRSVRLAAVWAIHLKTNQTQNWIADKLGLRSAANVSQQVRRIASPDPPAVAESFSWETWRKFVKKC